jgi:hypothetical protein
VLFGGADSASADFIPSDIEIRRNHFYKPLTWRVGDPSYAGTHWSVKNLLELKSARRAIIENNLFEQNWKDSQGGTAILFTVRNQNGTAPWSTIEDINFRSNIVIHAAAGLAFLGTDDEQTSGTLTRVAVVNNLWDDLSCSTWSDDCDTDWLSYFRGPDEVTTENNTVFNATGRLMLFASLDTTELVHRYNIGSYQTGGVGGDGTGQCDAAFAVYAPDVVFTGNVMTDNPSASSACTGHPGNFFPANMAAVGFENLGGGDYRLDEASDYYAAVTTNGADYGAYIPATGIQYMTISAASTGDGTTANVIFGHAGHQTDTDCIVRYGASITTSTSGATPRTVGLTGLTVGNHYFIGVDCGADGGQALSEDFIPQAAAGETTKVAGGIKITGGVKKQ